MHESFRSENILFFPQKSASANEKTSIENQAEVDLRQPWIFGFEFSRRESFFSAGFIDTCPERDVYRHPERQGVPLTTFKKTHDIYALGVVLLEIGKCICTMILRLFADSDCELVHLGIWRPAINLEKHRFANAKDSEGRPFGITPHLIKHAQKHLEKPMGQKYRDIVLKCLTNSFGVVDDNKEDLKLQQAFRSQVLETLRKIAVTI